MRKSVLIPVIGLAFSTFSIVGCNKKTEKKEQPGPDIVDNYTRETVTYTDKPAAPTTMVRFHYHRKDDDGSLYSYIKWSLWCWDTYNGGNGDRYQFRTYDDYGVICDLPLATVAAEGYSTTQQIGFIVSTENWSKDIDSDRYIDIKETAPGGVQEVYLMQGNSKIFDSAEAASMTTLGFARVDALNKVYVTFKPADDGFKFDKSKISVYVNGSSVGIKEFSDYNTKNNYITLTLKSSFEVNSLVQIQYIFSKKFTDSIKAVFTSYFDTQDFISAYNYTGNDLGVTFDNETNPTKTTFKLWSPVATQVVLNVYNTSDYRNDLTKVQEVEMTRGEKGVYSATINQDLDGKYYTYTVTTYQGTYEVVDPYAKSAGLNGRRGMVVNFTRLNSTITGWADDVRPSFGQHGYGSEAIVYEIHVRDMTINPNSGVSAENRGKYLGLAETGTTYTKDDTTVKTGLDHLEELGITHVQIQPFYDYSSVDESLDNSQMSDNNYNWGYDPLNYNVLEGSYSSNPSDGYARIKEFKQMVMALHAKGINVNMDVVYNHMSGFDTSNFQRIVPYYYFRTAGSGNPRNGSGCGNEVASNRIMVNKFIRDSVKFYTQEYHMSGYRFDLMGLMDNQVMIDIYNDNVALYDKIMVYGEPWTGGDTPLSGGTSADDLSNQKTVQASLAQQFFVGNGVLVGAFNDQIRNGIKGDNAPGTGWVNGAGITNGVKAGIKGMFSENYSQISPSQVINYVSCHDNYTLFDHLTLNTKNGRSVTNEYSQCETVIMMAFGVAFLQEGEDFLRSKNYEKDGVTVYEHNSYNVGDNINDMDYSLKVANKGMFDYFKELIALRKSIHAFGANTRGEVNARQSALTVNNNNVSYKVFDGNDTYLVIHCVSAGSFALDGSYGIVLDSVLNSATSIIDGAISLVNNQSVVLKLQ